MENVDACIPYASQPRSSGSCSPRTKTPACAPTSPRGPFGSLHSSNEKSIRPKPCSQSQNTFRKYGSSVSVRFGRKAWFQRMSPGTFGRGAFLDKTQNRATKIFWISIDLLFQSRKSPRVVGPSIISSNEFLPGSARVATGLLNPPTPVSGVRRGEKVRGPWTGAFG